MAKGSKRPKVDEDSERFTEEEMTRLGLVRYDVSIPCQGCGRIIRFYGVSTPGHLGTVVVCPECGTTHPVDIMVGWQ